MEIKKKDILNEQVIVEQLINEDKVETALMVAGFVPVIGNIADIALIIRYLRKGEYIYAALMVLALLPLFGDTAAKLLIKGIKKTGILGKGVLKSSDDMLKLLAKHPEIAKQYTKLFKHFNNPLVIKTVEKITKISPKLGSKLMEGLKQAKLALIHSGNLGKSIATTGGLGKGVKKFFQDKSLAKYITRTGTKPSTWVSNWWNVVRAGNLSRRKAFLTVVLGSNVLKRLGLPNISMVDLDNKIRNDENFRNEIANDPSISDFVGQNTSQQELSQIQGALPEQQNKNSGLLGAIASIGVLKMMARMYT